MLTLHPDNIHIRINRSCAYISVTSSCSNRMSIFHFIVLLKKGSTLIIANILYVRI